MTDGIEFIWFMQQVTGIGAVLCSFYAVSKPSGKKIMLTQALAGFLFMSHYLLSGLTNLAFISLTGIIASLVSSQATPRFLKQYNIAHSAVLISYLLFSMSKIYHIIPIFICLIGYYRSISRDNLQLFLMLACCMHVCWALYHAAFGTYYGMLNDGTLAFLNLLALYYRDKQKQIYQSS